MWSVSNDADLQIRPLEVALLRKKPNSSFQSPSLCGNALKHVVCLLRLTTYENVLSWLKMR